MAESKLAYDYHDPLTTSTNRSADYGIITKSRSPEFSTVRPDEDTPERSNSKTHNDPKTYGDFLKKLKKLRDETEEPLKQLVSDKNEKDIFDKLAKSFSEREELITNFLETIKGNKKKGEEQDKLPPKNKLEKKLKEMEQDEWNLIETWVIKERSWEDQYRQDTMRKLMAKYCHNHVIQGD